MTRFFLIFLAAVSFCSLTTATTGDCRDRILSDVHRLENYPPPLRNFAPALAPPPAPAPALGVAGRLGFAPQPSASLPRLASLDDFDSLAKATPIGGKQQKVVKAVYHRGAPGGPQLYFIDTRRFPYHYQFATQVLGYRSGPEVFNKNYEGDGQLREFNLASLLQFELADGKPCLLLDLWTGDTLSAPYVEELFKTVQAHVDLPVLFHPTSVDQESLSEQLSLPILTNADIYGDQTYMALNEGETYGYLRFIEPDDAHPLLGPTDIPVFSQVPNDIGLVAGVITEQFQTPLSHVNVKSRNRGTINFSLLNAKEKLAPYRDKPVRIRVTANGYEIELLSETETEAPAQIAAFWATRKPKLDDRPESVLDPRYNNALVPLHDYYHSLPSAEAHRQLIRVVGAKAANLGLLNWLTRQAPDALRVTSPKTVGVPFNFFDSFMRLEQPGLDPQNPSVVTTPWDLLLAVLNRDQLLNNQVAHPIQTVRPALKAVRDLIRRAKVPEPLIQLLKQAIWEDTHSVLHYTKNPLLLFRSSTNSEDLKGFTGAGLYNSTSLPLYKVHEGALVLRPWSEIEADLRQKIPYLYSAIWNERAYMEREWFSLDGEQHLEIKAGLAVHGGFSGTLTEGPVGETANGVAITANIFNLEDFEKIYINGQHYDLSVTNPPSEEELRSRGEDPNTPYRTEEILVTTFLPSWEESLQPDAWQRWPFDRLRASSVKGGTSVFRSAQETRRLAWVLREIKHALAAVNQQDPDTFAADVEWNIFGRDRVLSINQARPFGHAILPEPH